MSWSKMTYCLWCFKVCSTLRIKSSLIKSRETNFSRNIALTVIWKGRELSKVTSICTFSLFINHQAISFPQENILLKAKAICSLCIELIPWIENIYILAWTSEQSLTSTANYSMVCCVYLSKLAIKVFLLQLFIQYWFAQGRNA